MLLFDCWSFTTNKIVFSTLEGSLFVVVLTVVDVLTVDVAAMAVIAAVIAVVDVVTDIVDIVTIVVSVITCNWTFRTACSFKSFCSCF